MCRFYLILLLGILCFYFYKQCTNDIILRIIQYSTFNFLRQFHLKRFEYDPYQDDLAKINDRFEFPTELDMSPWLEDTHSRPEDAAAASAGTDGTDDARADTYKLSAVVMHVGGPAFGHYYAYVRYSNPAKSSSSSSSSSSSPRPESADELKMQRKGKTSSATAAAAAAAPEKGEASSADQKRPPSPAATTWVKLDDHRVTEVSEAEVLRDAFGGGGGAYKGPGSELQGLFGQVGTWCIYVLL